MTLVRELIKRYHTAEEIQRHLASTVTKTRVEKATYNDLVKALGADKVKTLDESLKAAGMEWLQRQLTGAGVDLADDETRAVFTKLATASSIQPDDSAAIKNIGVSKSVQWREYGLPSLPTVAEVQAEIDGLVIDGQSISMAVSVTPQGDSLCLSVSTMAGRERVDTIHGLVTSGANDKNLTPKQQEFVAAVLALVKTYEVP